MKKECSFVVAFFIFAFATCSMAATQSFWASEIQSDDARDAGSTLLSSGQTKTFDINYSLGDNWVINSAKLWLRAVDDYTVAGVSYHCANSSQCSDDNISSTPQDRSEQTKVISIEGIEGTYGSTVEINNFDWYDLNVNVANYLSNTDKNFSATIKAITGDYFYKNAKLVIDYDIKPVPVPAAVWLFGSALLGLMGKKRKSIAPAVAV